MERSELLAKLELIAPALAKHEMIPVMTSFWFTGKRVMAFNDQIGISTPLLTEFTGAIAGTVLLNLLKATHTQKVEMIPQNENVIIKTGNSRFTLGLIPKEHFVFELPQPKKNSLFPVDRKQFLDGIDVCLRSVSSDTSVPDQLGVSLVPDGRTLMLFSTDNQTLSHAKARLTDKVSWTKRIVLPRVFCEQLLAMADKDKPLQLEIHDNYALFTNNVDVLFGRLIATDRPLDFKQMLEFHLPNGTGKKMLEFPKGLSYALERAIIMTSNDHDKTSTLITCKDGKMKLFSKSGMGEIQDLLKVDGQPDVQIRVNAGLVKEGYPAFDKMLITASCWIMATGDSLYLVSASDET